MDSLFMPLLWLDNRKTGSYEIRHLVRILALREHDYQFWTAVRTGRISIKDSALLRVGYCCRQMHRFKSTRRLLNFN